MAAQLIRAMPDDMSMLRSVGLSEHGERVYRSLITRHMSARELAADTGLSEKEVRATLGPLESKGLITSRPGKPVRYAATPPDVALNALVHRQEAELHAVRALAGSLAEEFRKAAQSSSPLDVLEIISGPEEMVQRVGLLERSAEASILIFDKPPYLRYPNPEESVRIREGIDYRVLYEQASVEMPGQLEEIRRCIGIGENARLYPELPMKLTVIDDRFAFAPLYPPIMGGLLIHSSPLLRAMILLFETLWEKAIPLTIAGEGVRSTDVTDELEPHEKELLGLLAMGQKDETIARTLGVTRRTVQRRITDLMTKVGANNRYQAGLQAGLRGWH